MSSPASKSTAPPVKSPRSGGRRQLGSGGATSLPVYHQLHLVLSQRVREGIYAPGSRFPSEFELAKVFGVSRVSVRRALGRLEEEGLIVRKRGAGTFVAERSPQARGPISGEVDNLITIGFETQTRLIRHGEAAYAPPQAYGALDVAMNEPLFEIERLRLYREQPFSLTNVYLRENEASLLDPEALGAQPVIQALEAAGLRSADAEQTISATLADDRTADLLEVSIGSALVRVRRAVRDPEGRTLLFQQSLYRPDRYEYHMLLTREHSSGHPRWRHIG
ncbi:GntR family transcriptional regulator [Novosphingobium sp. YJ-S2-02]|uniref:GntR family transcriptional regulator n=1 Tax=Novosphingobium aureum TaxID=2792964 RepID=A0A931HET4_9SPHN|nr:GntR family transcriptional regulator [Novosphingobium aureum]MBH0114454.1 GntR family transcriptional regulator [Novosphingobium aureum]